MDFYPTPHSIITSILDHWHYDGVIWEPCVGDGRFSEAIGGNVLSGDISTGQDFFSYTEALSDVIVTNPPFSRSRDFIDHAFDIGVKRMVLVCPERLWACKKGLDQWNRHRPSLWVNLSWREDYLNKGGSPDRALAVAVWDSPHSDKCEYEIWGKPPRF